MATCEMCGREGADLRAEVEGVVMQLCVSCARHGRVLAQPKQVLPAVIRTEAPEMMVVEEYGALLRKSREQVGMTQEEFAKHVQERESVVAKWEQGTLKPGVETAQRLGKKLGLALVVKSAIEVGSAAKRGASEELTLGDFVKVRKRK